jgi:hypothetical protein
MMIAVCPVILANDPSFRYLFPAPISVSASSDAKNDVKVIVIRRTEAGRIG